MGKTVEVYGSDDYCGMVTGERAFYYGYERTSCPNHGTEECECDEREWCFTAREDGKEVARYTTSELEASASRQERYREVDAYLLLGIGKYLASEPHSSTGGTA